MTGITTSRRSIALALLVHFIACFHSVLSARIEGSRRRLQRLSHAFERVWHGPELHATKLLDACQIFADGLGETGLEAVKRDFSGNLRKAKGLLEDSKKGPSHPKPISTLGAILQYERDVLKTHDGEKLKDPSGAVGFLWMRRSLEFQTELYIGLIKGKSSVEAALAAYETRLRPYHGPVLRRFYTAFFRSMMPSRKSMLQRLGGMEDAQYAENVVIKDLELLARTWVPILTRWKKDFVMLGLEDSRAV